jgi:hypothetical protein
MIASLRQRYNASFTNEKYHAMLDELDAQFHHRPPFRIAETPIFIPDDLKVKLFEASDHIIDVIAAPDFKEKSKGALLAGQTVPNETDHTLFLQMDFGVCLDKDDCLHPYLIEAQGFPSLYFYQHTIAGLYRKYFDVPADYSHLFGGLTEDAYIELLRKMIVGNHDPKHVILLEVEPKEQATLIDFIICKYYLGIEYVCVSDLKIVGNDVFYKKNGQLIQVERIYNRVIFDELLKRDDLQRDFYFMQPYNVEWAGHPNWFFRISKHTLPLLSGSPYVPNALFLNDLTSIPDDLENYVLKPLYSFSGSGVIINLNRYDIDAVEDPENYILQQKVQYAPIIETPNVPAKCEIRMLTVWEEGAARPRMVNNLARLSKGEMIGVKYNKNKDWVGGSVGYFKK